MTIRVLHVVKQLNPGGVETWLLNLIRVLDRTELEVDVAVTSQEPGLLEDAFRAEGVRIHRLGSPRNFPAFYRAFKLANKAYGPYDVLHSHLHYFSGVILLLGAIEGIRCRISHSHTDTRESDGKTLGRRLYTQLMKFLIMATGTSHLAVGSEAAEALYGEDWREKRSIRISRCGIDVSRFIPKADNREVGRRLRSEFGISGQSLIVGTVGRLVKEKNQLFLIEVFKELLKLREDAHLVIAGDGPLRELLTARASLLGVADRVVILGNRQDVPELLTSLFDIFLLPSRVEGLPLAALEAQAAGLPCMLSSRITKEAIVVDENVRTIELTAGPNAWASELVSFLERPRLSREEALRKMLESQFAINVNARELQEIYCHNR